MAHKTYSSPSRYSLDTSNSQLEHECDTSQDFLNQNELISQEILKCDKSLYCPTRTFKVLALLYFLSFLGDILLLIKDKARAFDTFLPTSIFYTHFCLNMLLFLLAMWACFVSWRVIYSKDPFKLNKPILIFKAYFCFVIGIETPIFCYYMKRISWETIMKQSMDSPVNLITDAIIAATSVLMAMRIKNILLRHKPFHEASSFYVNSNASFMQQRV